jgi:hypothetical protein
VPETADRLDPAAALVAADGREGAAAIWQAAVGRAVSLRRALGRAGGESKPVGDAQVVDEFFDAPLRALPDARSGLTVAAGVDGLLAVQAPTAWHREVVTGLAGEADPARWAQAVTRWAEGEKAEPAAELLQELGIPAFPAPSAWARDGRGRGGAKAGASPARRSLDGVTVVELGGLWAAPLACKLLGDLGARVLKVEAPGRPDGARAGPPSHFRALNEGKATLKLDLRRDADRGLLLAELGPDTVLIENNTARVLANLGLPAETILARGAALVRLPASRRRPGWRGLGSTIELAAGLGRRPAGGDEALPTCAPIPLTDPLAGATAALAALAALAAPAGAARLRTVGQLEDVALPLADAAGARGTA